MSIDKVDHPKGFAFAIVAYLLWGFLPIYMKALSHVPAAEVVAHRVIWSVPVAMIVLVALRRTSDLKNALRSKRVMVSTSSSVCVCISSVIQMCMKDEDEDVFFLHIMSMSWQAMKQRALLCLCPCHVKNEYHTWSTTKYR